MSRAVHDHSCWGKGDQLGAGNYLTPEKRLETLALVRRGELIDLSHIIEFGAPRYEPVQTPICFWARQTGKEPCVGVDRPALPTTRGGTLNALK